MSAFRRRQREIRIAAGLVTILLAAALVFNLPAVLQRAIPDYTSALQKRVGGDDTVREKLNLGGIINDQNAALSNCTNGAPKLEDCGPVPDIKGITGWLNTPGDQPIDLRSLRGRVVLVDFWAYSCINCQRAIPHVVGWYRAYKDSGLAVIGVHTPEYAFEQVPTNVAAGAADLGITYPVALDNHYSTWTNYRNRYWPAEYLIDANGTVRHIKVGEGDYNATENLIRQLLVDVNRGAELPPPMDGADNTPAPGLTPETYFGVGKMVNFAGAGVYDQGSSDVRLPARVPHRGTGLEPSARRFGLCQNLTPEADPIRRKLAVASTEVEHYRGVDVAEVPSAAWGWSRINHRTWHVIGFISFVFLLAMLRGNHVGHVEDWFLSRLPRSRSPFWCATCGAAGAAGSGSAISGAPAGTRRRRMRRPSLRSHQGQRHRPGPCAVLVHPAGQGTLQAAGRADQGVRRARHASH